MKKLMLIGIVALFFFGITNVANALTCEFNGTSGIELFSVYRENNTHIGEVDYYATNFTCDVTSATFRDGSCNANEKAWFSVNKTNNTHIGDINYYGKKLCIAPQYDCYVNTTGDCGSGETEIFSVNKTNNTHIGEVDYYSSAFCCEKTCQCGDYCIDELPYEIAVDDASYCMVENLSATGTHGVTYGTDNTILDCQGQILDGDETADKYGVYLTSDDNNNTVRNCTIQDFHVGVHIDGAYNNTIENTIIRSNSYEGLYLAESGGNLIINTTIANNTNWDIFFGNMGNVDCNNTFSNVNGTENKPIVYYHSESVVIEDWNNNASEIILCNCDNSIIDNVSLEHQIMENGVGLNIIRTRDSNITNIYLNNFFYGIFLHDASSWYNNLTNITIENGKTGIWIFSKYNILDNLTIKNNTQYGVEFGGMDNNTIKNSIFENNARGIQGSGMGFGGINVIYNNLFNNTDNVYLTGGFENYWNTTNQTGNRIYSDGTNIGGNYWTNSSGTGYSDTCTDSDQDGFCDSAYDVKNNAEGCTSNNCDYLPYSDEYVEEAGEDILRQVQEIIDVITSPRRVATVIRQVMEDIFVNESEEREIGFLREEGENITLNESEQRAISELRIGEEEIQINETAEREVGIERQAQEEISIIESILRIFAGRRTGTEIINITDSAEWFRSLLRLGTEEIGINESAEQFRSLLRSGAETIILNDEAIRIWSGLRAVAEEIGIIDTAEGTVLGFGVVDPELLECYIYSFLTTRNPRKSMEFCLTRSDDCFEDCMVIFNNKKTCNFICTLLGE